MYRLFKICYIYKCTNNKCDENGCYPSMVELAESTSID